MIQIATIIVAIHSNTGTPRGGASRARARARRYCQLCTHHTVLYSASPTIIVFPLWFWNRTMDAELALFEAEIQKLSAAAPAAGSTEPAGGAVTTASASSAVNASSTASASQRTVPIGVGTMAFHFAQPLRDPFRMLSAAMFSNADADGAADVNTQATVGSAPVKYAAAAPPAPAPVAPDLRTIPNADLGASRQHHNSAAAPVPPPGQPQQPPAPIMSFPRPAQADPDMPCAPWLACLTFRLTGHGAVMPTCH